MNRDRRAIAVEGLVQGVGFRPFVHALATRFSLGGFVRNSTGGVLIEIEGDRDDLDRFVRELQASPPPLARFEDVRASKRPAIGETRFRIESSTDDAAAGTGTPVIAADVATCDACLAELFDPADRRFEHPFINCTNCGPRLTIVTGAPYDRERTTMRAFAMCAACRAEYEDPADRRFHAQPIACPNCGPRLSMSVDDAAIVLRSGAILAIKGLGGWHLACDATDAKAVRTLRERKHRDDKPFAVMVADRGAARAHARIAEAEAELLSDRTRPIVLLERTSDAIADAVAPRSKLLGLMLPYTALHHLLLRRVNVPLVMTSGNLASEPIAYEDDDARARLGAIADAFLGHDRPIHTRCDDSIARVFPGASAPTMLRRSRGCAPAPIRLPHRLAKPTLATGGDYKSAFALGDGDRAFLGHHLGDLEHLDAFTAFEHAIDAYTRLFRIRPTRAVCDLHPDYASSRFAHALGVETVVTVQHHHAHFAACLADADFRGPAIGVIFDGSGFGTDGTIWGGEVFVGDAREARRVAHLVPVAMPGGETAVREPWRMAAAHLARAGVESRSFSARIGDERLRTVRSMIERRVNAPMTSSMGRLFDAVASIAGVRDRVRFEGQAAMELEAIASGEGAYEFAILEDGAMISIDPARVIAEVASEPDAALASARFHGAVGRMIADVCGLLRDRTGISDVVLSGGVFQNAILARTPLPGFRVHRHHRVPPNDGGLALGQLAIAAARDAHEGGA